MDISKLVCLGDSLTEGYNIHQENRWSELIAKQFSFPVINSGISGDTTAGILARFSADVIDHQPSHVIIMGGTNDLYFDIPDNIIISNIKTMLRQASYHGMKSVVGIPPAIFPTQDNYSMFVSENELLQRVVSFQKNLKLFLKTDGQQIIDFSQMDRALFLMDGVHPNESGQVHMAQLVLEQLQVES